ncbi:MAG: nickel pincer cofactor biosynthesis protein LarC [Vicinamibacterales bacterium]
MGRVMYLDCGTGAAGDMLLGALIDAGLPVQALRDALGSLGVNCEVQASRVLRSGLTATKFDVVETTASATTPHSHDHGPGHTHDQGQTHEHGHGQAHDHPHSHGTSHAHAHADGSHRSLHDIAHLIGHSALSAAGKLRAKALFRRLAEAEAAIHSMPVDEVHLHEVGALDSIVDIVGFVFALEWYGIDDIVASPLNVGGGQVDIAHGRFPVPAPATVSLLLGVPVYSEGPQVELTTPTGALLVSDYAREYGPVPAMTIAAVGYGAGSRDFPDRPNVVRVLIGERTARPVPDESRPDLAVATASAEDQPAAGATSVVEIQCEIDDMNPQLFGAATERLFAAGALDVFLTAVQMKKGRPGTLMTVLGREEDRAALCAVLFRETTTIGVRFTRVWRETLERRFVDVATRDGSVRIKVATGPGLTPNAAPEFEDCLRIAERTGRSVKDVHAEALGAWLNRPTIE